MINYPRKVFYDQWYWIYLASKRFSLSNHPAIISFNYYHWSNHQIEIKKNKQRRFLIVEHKNNKINIIKLFVYMNQTVTCYHLVVMLTMSFMWVWMTQYHILPKNVTYRLHASIVMLKQSATRKTAFTRAPSTSARAQPNVFFDHFLGDICKVKKTYILIRLIYVRTWFIYL